MHFKFVLHFIPLQNLINSFLNESSSGSNLQLSIILDLNNKKIIYFIFSILVIKVFLNSENTFVILYLLLLMVL